jgi:hypothetical protein
VGRDRKKKSKPKLSAKERAARSTARVNRSAAKLLAATAKALEQPPADESVIGHQPHFLRRIERLTGDARAMAERLYHDSTLTRYLALSLLGRDADGAVLYEMSEDDEVERVAVDLDSGLDPGKAIIDTLGKVVTCFAPGMPVASVTRFPYKVVSAQIEAFEERQSHLQIIQEHAEGIDPATHFRILERRGWSSPREALQILQALGGAGRLLFSQRLKDAHKRYLTAFADAIKSAGLGTDKDLRTWFRSTGEVAAYLVLHADLRIEPSTVLLRSFFAAHDAILAMVIGACLARWRPADAEVMVFENVTRSDDMFENMNPFSVQFALTTYFGSLQRMYLRSPGTTRLYARIDDWMFHCHGFYDEEYRELRRLGLPENLIVTIMRDLNILARGRRPDWGDDLADDPTTLPPLRLDDYCLPGGLESPRVIRILAQRLFQTATEGRPLIHIFQPIEDLEQWEEKLGHLDHVRNGVFCLPWFEQDELPRHCEPTPGRNDPCPCGSGKKFKKCCYDKEG